MKPKARQVVFLEYEQFDGEAPSTLVPGIALSDPDIGNFCFSTRYYSR
jgi:hypothetical protein